MAHIFLNYVCNHKHDMVTVIVIISLSSPLFYNLKIYSIWYCLPVTIYKFNLAQLLPNMQFYGLIMIYLLICVPISRSMPIAFEDGSSYITATNNCELNFSFENVVWKIITLQISAKSPSDLFEEMSALCRRLKYRTESNQKSLIGELCSSLPATPRELF